MPKHRSITQLVRRCRDPQTRLEIALAWAAEWERDQSNLVALLDQAQQQGDLRQVYNLLTQLHSSQTKRFDALPGVLRSVAGDD